LKKLVKKDYIHRDSPATIDEYEEFLSNVLYKDRNVLRINAARAQKIKKKSKSADVDEEEIEMWIRRIWYLWMRKKVKGYREIFKRRVDVPSPPRQKHQPPVESPSKREVTSDQEVEAPASVEPSRESRRKRARESVVESERSESMSLPEASPRNNKRQKRPKCTMDPAVKVTLDIFWEQRRLTLEQVRDWVNEKAEQLGETTEEAGL
jgi:hypothetical protein